MSADSGDKIQQPGGVSAWGKRGMREGCVGFVGEGFAGAVVAWRERGSGGHGRGEHGREVGDDMRDPSIRGREGDEG
jgi:hypothetical protein